MNKYITIDNSVHGVMVAFAFGSVTNVYSYFAGSGHDPLASGAMAVALGTALATSAIMATKINMRKEARSFVAVLSMVLAVGLVSGYIQTQGYIAHGVTGPQAAIMGFGVPLAGEFLLALALAIYTGAIKRTKVYEADTALEVKVSESIAEVMAAVDVSNSAKYVERKIGAIIKHKADEILSSYIPAEADANDPNVEKRKTGPEKPKDNQIPNFGPEKLPAANDKRAEIIQNRRAAIVGMLELGPAKRSDIQGKLSELGFDVSADTLRSDLDAIGAIRNGHTYSLPAPPSWDQLELQTMPENEPQPIYTNGIGG